MASIHEDSGRGELKPLAVTIPKASAISGFGPTSIWAFLKDGRLKAVRVPGVRRTLVSYASLAQLLALSEEAFIGPRRRGRPRRTVLPGQGKNSCK
jgi:hypothetical protein